MMTLGLPHTMTTLLIFYTTDFYIRPVMLNFNQLLNIILKLYILYALSVSTIQQMYLEVPN